MIRCWTQHSRTTHQTLPTDGTESNYTMIPGINNEERFIGIQHHSARLVQWDRCSIGSVSSHRRRICLSRAKQLNAIVPKISDIKIEVECHEDAPRRVEQILREPRTTRSSHYARWIRWALQRATEHLMAIVLRAVEIIVRIDKHSRTLRTDWHRCWKSRSIRCPAIDPVVWITIVDEDLFVTCHEETPRRGEISENGVGWIDTSIAPDEDFSVIRPSDEESVQRVDKQSVWIETNDSAVGQGGGIGIPRGVGTELRLINWWN